nr:NADH dehydrogenase subunit 5 [Hoplopleura edentula]
MLDCFVLIKSVKLYLYSVFLLLTLLFLALTCSELGVAAQSSGSWDVMSLHGMNMSVELLMDFHSSVFMVTVLLVSSMVLLYSMFYMPVPGKNGFLVTLTAFIFSMLLLVVSKSLFWAIMGWDGLGVTSLLLILHFKNCDSAKSAMVTFLTNRMGDVFMLVAIGLAVMLEVLNQWLGLCVLLCAMTKSAQFPFSAWLPLAMAAPTPVSSLVHSSTLVTAGVFLLIRFNWVLSGLEWYVGVVSFLTLCYSGISALYEWDVKKIIAFSTLSHLSLMVMMIAIGSVSAASFHMAMHALFKSVLFMLAGGSIYLSSDVQDIRNMKLSKNSSFSESLFWVALLSMAGLPALSGFYSKELMSNMTFSMSLTMAYKVWFLIGVMLTSGYSLRLIAVILLHSTAPTQVSCKTITPLYMPSSMMFIMVAMAGASVSWLLAYKTPPFAGGLWSQTMGVAMILAIVLGAMLGISLSKFSTSMPLASYLFNKWSVYSTMKVIVYVNSVSGKVPSSDFEGATLNYIKSYVIPLNEFTKWESPLVLQSFTPIKITVMAASIIITMML